MGSIGSFASFSTSDLSLLPNRPVPVKLRPHSQKLPPNGLGLNIATLQKSMDDDIVLGVLDGPAPFVIGDFVKIDNEVMEVKGIMANNIMVQRGAKGSKKSPHKAGSTVVHTKGDHDDMDVDHDVKMFESLREKALDEDFEDLDEMNFIELMEETTGTGHARTFVYIISEHYFRSKNVDDKGRHNDERLLCYLINRLDNIVHDTYNIVYFHSGKTKHQLEFSFLSKAYKVLSREYKSNLSNVWVVHPTVWVRMAYFFCSPFMDQNVTQLTTICHSIQDLYKDFNKEGLPLPKVVIQTEQSRASKWFSATPRVES